MSKLAPFLNYVLFGTPYLHPLDIVTKLHLGLEASSVDDSKTTAGVLVLLQCNRNCLLNLVLETSVGVGGIRIRTVISILEYLKPFRYIPNYIQKIVRCHVGLFRRCGRQIDVG